MELESRHAEAIKANPEDASGQQVIVNTYELKSRQEELEARNETVMELVFNQVWSPSVNSYINQSWHPSSSTSFDLCSLFQKWCLLMPAKVLARFLEDKVLPKLEQEVDEVWLPSDFDLHFVDFLLNWDSIFKDQEMSLKERFRSLISKALGKID